jgi:hypothetical protein
VISTAAKATSEIGGKADAYRTFWGRFIERVQLEHPGWTNARVPSGDNWITMKCPMKGCLYGVNFAMGGKTRAELYIDTGDGDENQAILEGFAEHKEEIEGAFGAPLSWEELPGKRACRIAYYGAGDAADLDSHDAYIDWMFDASSRLRRALEPFA